MRFSAQEKKLITLLKKQKLSQSHQFDHLLRVAELGSQLAKIYRAERKVVVGAALTHDLGRSQLKWRGKESAVEGARLAEPLLKQAGYAEQAIQLIKQVVAEHDDPLFHSQLLESRILKEADFVDGFGARGIMRSIMYAGETGGGNEEAWRRLRQTMKQRLESLQFKETRRLGWQQYRLVEVFLLELEEATKIESVSYPGKLIVIEGISGSGKDTQAKMLKQYLQVRGERVKLIHHPTAFLKKLWRRWRRQVDDRLSEAFLMMADRARMIKTEIMPALQKGETVISIRSSISAQVYQQDDRFKAELYRRIFAVFEPTADLIIYLDVSSQTALKRADERVRRGQEKDRGFFGVEQEEYRKRFKRILKQYTNVVVVKASGSKNKVFKRLISSYSKI